MTKELLTDVAIRNAKPDTKAKRFNRAAAESIAETERCETVAIGLHH